MVRSPASKARSARRGSSILLPTRMEGAHQGQVGNFGGFRGSRYSSLEGSSSVCGPYLLSSTRRCREGSSPLRRGQFLDSQGCCGGASKVTLDSRLLLPDVSCQEEIRGLASDYRPQCIQQACSLATLQNGDTSKYLDFGSSRYVGDLNRPQGRLFPYTDKEIGQEIPEIHFSGQSVPVQGHALRSDHRPFGVHQATSGGCGLFTQSRSRYPYLFRRLPDAAYRPSLSALQHQVGLDNSSTPRFYPFTGEIRGSSIPGLHFPGKPFPYGSGPRSSSSVQVPESQGVGYSAQQSGLYSGQVVSEASRIPQFPFGCRTPGSAPYSPSSDVSSFQMETCIPRVGCSDSIGSFRQGLGHVVGFGGQCFEGRLSSESVPYSNSVYGRIYDGLGCLPQRSVSFRGLAGGSTPGTHQCAGDESSSASHSVPTASAAGSVHLSGYRQCYSGSLFGESGGYKVSQAMCPHYQDSSSLSGYGSVPLSEASSRAPECFSRHAIQITESSYHRMDPEQVYIQGHLHGLGDSSCRSVCHSSEFPDSDVRVSSSGSFGLGSRCSIPELGGSSGICLPSIQPPGQGTSQGQESRLLGSPDSTSVAQTALVSGSSGFAGRSPLGHSGQVESPQPAQIQTVSPQSGTPTPSRVEAISVCLLQAGFSAEVTDGITRSIRSSSSAIYESRWSVFCSWCISRKIDPLGASIQLIAEFFLYLFKVRELAPSTIRGYRSALANVFSFRGRSDVGTCSTLSNLLRSFSLEKPKVRILTPQWDLALVLDSLTRSPYEPLASASVKFLFWKTVFLIALASGRRRSEIHALSSSPSCLRWSRNYSLVTLLTDPSFLAKNQVPNFSPDPIKIPALKAVSGPNDQDLLLCPCRALKFYLDKTKGGRQGPRPRLFLSIKAKQSDISSQTISRWICETIQKAYEGSTAETRDSVRVRAHEVRALSASWAFLNGTSYDEVMASAFWRGRNTFADFYLRSLSSHADGLYSLGPLVTAQSVTCPPVNP
ncbi:hypothetical protein CI610_02751 [invertebrate metagenome]|uniref:Core-binding (CB) domain-containing protein n=1 Tax=invertebrate metagenome TaxID=1711999 RepID=A0A2H9T530_9ZZZZ